MEKNLYTEPLLQQEQQEKICEEEKESHLASWTEGDEFKMVMGNSPSSFESSSNVEMLNEEIEIFEESNPLPHSIMDD